MFERIVLNVPHSSPVFPLGKENWDVGIDIEIERWTDWYTDWLFQSIDPRVIPVVYPFSRFFCDVERLENDPMESVGQGIIYKQFNGLLRTISSLEEEWVRQSYREHIGRLKTAIQNKHTLLIDCHSFPKDLSNVDICIGFNDDWSKPHDSIIKKVEGVFLSAGYIVGINTPYTNSISPLMAFNYQSIMIEVNKKAYLRSNSVLDKHRSMHLKHILTDLYKTL